MALRNSERLLQVVHRYTQPLLEASLQIFGAFRRIQEAYYFRTVWTAPATVDKAPGISYARESMLLLHRETHLWFWFRGQEIHEAVIFTSFDSIPGSDVPGKTMTWPPHWAP